MAYVTDQRTVGEEYDVPTSYFLVRRVIFYVTNLVELILALRLVFKAFSANPGAGFVRFIYQLTEPLVAPFRGIFPVFQGQDIIVEWSTVMAMVVYALAAVLIVEFFRAVIPGRG